MQWSDMIKAIKPNYVYIGVIIFNIYRIWPAAVSVLYFSVNLSRYYDLKQKCTRLWYLKPELLLLCPSMDRIRVHTIVLIYTYLYHKVFKLL